VVLHCGHQTQQNANAFFVGVGMDGWMDGLVVFRLLQKSGRFAQYYYFNTKISKQGKKKKKKKKKKKRVLRH